MLILLGIILFLVILVWSIASSCNRHMIDREDSDNSQMKELARINSNKIKESK